MPSLADNLRPAPLNFCILWATSNLLLLRRPWPWPWQEAGLARDLSQQSQTCHHPPAHLARRESLVSSLCLGQTRSLFLLSPSLSPTSGCRYSVDHPQTSSDKLQASVHASPQPVFHIRLSRGLPSWDSLTVGVTTTQIAAAQ